MKSYTEATDGAYIESKESALVWNHQYADVEFGSCQAKELSNHLQSLLIDAPVLVHRGQNIVEVKPQVCLTIAKFYMFLFLNPLDKYVYPTRYDNMFSFA